MDEKRATVAVALRRSAWAIAAGRVALGIAAIARPALPARPWVGGDAGTLGARVFARAVGGRDIALGLGTLGALATDQGAAAGWVAAGALADALDVAVSIPSWPELPRASRWVVVTTAAGAALTGAAAVVALWRRPRP